MSVVVQNANSVIQAQPFTINRIKLAKQDKPVTIQRTNLNSKQIHVSAEKLHASQLQGLFHLTRIHRENTREQITNKPSVNRNFWKVSASFGMSFWYTFGNFVTQWFKSLEWAQKQQTALLEWINENFECTPFKWEAAFFCTFWGQPYCLFCYTLTNSRQWQILHARKLISHYCVLWWNFIYFILGMWGCIVKEIIAVKLYCVYERLPR